MGEPIHTVDPWGNGNDDSLSQVACGSDQDAFMLRQTRDGADQRGGYSSFLFRRCEVERWADGMGGMRGVASEGGVCGELAGQASLRTRPGSTTDSGFNPGAGAHHPGRRPLGHWTYGGRGLERLLHGPWVCVGGSLAGPMPSRVLACWLEQEGFLGGGVDSLSHWHAGRESGRDRGVPVQCARILRIGGGQTSIGKLVDARGRVCWERQGRLRRGLAEIGMFSLRSSDDQHRGILNLVSAILFSGVPIVTVHPVTESKKQGRREINASWSKAASAEQAGQWQTKRNMAGRKHAHAENTKDKSRSRTKEATAVVRCLAPTRDFLARCGASSQRQLGSSRA
ncbi:hypothetical protein MAPG_02495 [Magnaporthiopsis poae ATCC 64411]|uniref:Uncharacterized protein n=1 Tax=Magnaporthiopsis poae (strain ATCC 64411 / 73-15) TaxID=644358 RepID=A0A0C4DRI6_MAGP6|nr:hypothetical protein MAPG_02495 [Magnaporthiopsis poae ATCC 64411]